jgi:hypothetical protein
MNSSRSTRNRKRAGGKLIKNAGGYIGQDRVGSVGSGRFFPYGQELSATSDNTEKFATYYRDAETGC